MMKKLLCTFILLVTTIGFVQAQSINVTGLGTIIPGDGSNVPIVADDTEYGSLDITALPITHQFTINNLSAVPVLLNLNPLSNSVDFSQDGLIPNPIAPGGFATFNVNFDPATTGLKGSVVTVQAIPLSTFIPETYFFNVQGTGTAATAPDITVIGAGTPIANLDFSPSTLDDTEFGVVDVATGSVTHTFTIFNDGNADLNISGILEFSDHFTISSLPTSPIGPGLDSTFDVTFDPNITGPITTNIIIQNDDPDENPFVFAVGGQGVNLEPDINITGNGINIVDGDTTPSLADGTNFGQVNTGSSLTRTFTIQNTGTQALFINLPVGVTGNAAFSISLQPNFQVNPGTSSTFNVDFSPTAAGVVTGTVSVSSNDPDESPYTFNVQGEGIVPDIPDINVTGNGITIANGDTTPSVADDTDYGLVGIGSSLTRTYFIENNGTQPLFISLPVTATGDPAFAVITSPDFQIDPGTSSFFDVEFTPTTTGIVNSTITITSNDPNDSVYTYVVQGEGIITAPEMDVFGGSPLVEIANGDVTPDVNDDTDYGQVDVAAGAILHTFTIQNNGNAPLNLTDADPFVTITGDADFSLTARPANPILPGGSATFIIAFDPATIGIKTAIVSIANDDSDENPYTFTIQGEGINLLPEMDVFGNGVEIADDDTTPDLADDTDFGQADVFTGLVTNTFTIQNNGGADLNLTDPSPYVVISGANASDFTLTLLPSSPITAAGSVTFEITFDPSALGIRSASVSIANDDSDENPYNFDIQGEGIDNNADAPLLITQYYEGVGTDRWVEVKNISASTVIAGSYYLALYSNFNTIIGNISTNAPNENVAIPTMAPGDVVLFSSLTATLPLAGNRGTAPVIPTNVCSFDGNDVILISTTNGVNTYSNRIDIMGVVDAVTPRVWGQNKGFIKGCNTTEQPNTSFDATIGPPLVVNDYIELTLAEVDDANPLINIALGTQGIGSTTWDGVAWDNEVPGRTREVIINGTYDASDGSFEACNILVLGNFNFNGGTTNFIEVHNDLTISGGGTFTIGDTESLYFPGDNEDAVITGSITKLETTTSLTNINDFTYYSSPVANASIASVFSANNPNRVFYWDQSVTNTIPGGGTEAIGEWIVASGTMRPAKGYISEGPISGTYPLQQTVAFTGTPNNGVIGISGNPHMVYNNDGNINNDFNLVGNPYPSAIDADEFIGLVDNNTIDGTLWFWTHNTPVNSDPVNRYTNSDYATYNLSGGTAAASGGPTPTGNIGSGQGFMVRATEPGPGVIFNNFMRLIDQNTQFFRGTETKNAVVEEKDRVWLNVESTDGGAFNQTLIGFFDQATDGHDRGYDGVKLGASWVSLYSKIDTVKYAIQGLGSFNIDKTIPIGFDTYINEALSYKINIANIEGVLKENDLYLIDRDLNITHDLKQADYTFDLTGVGNHPDRFTLQFTKAVLGIDDLAFGNDFVIINEDQALRLRSSNVIKDIKVYDLLGRLLIDQKPNDSEFNIRTDNIRKGTVLIVKATFDNGAELSKKAIKY